MRTQTDLAEIRGLSGFARKHGQSLRVLIVEDDVAVGELLQGFVRDLGHETELVPSAEAALQRLQMNRPDLVFLDRKSTRLNSSHVAISYAVFCLKKKNIF